MVQFACARVHDDIGLLISDVDLSCEWEEDERIYVHDFIVQNEMFLLRIFPV